MKLLNKLQNKFNNSNYDFTKHFRYLMFIPLILVLVGLIVFSFCGFNLSYDFTDTYSVTVKYSSSLEESVKNEYKDNITKIIKDNNVSSYEFTISQDSSYNILTYRYRAIDNKNESQMIELGEAIKDDIVALGINENDVTVSDLIPKAYQANIIGNLALAFGLGLVGVIIYLFIRFDYASALNIIVSMFIDWLLLFAIYSICRIPMDISILAVFVTTTLLGLVNNVVLYDKIRENLNDEQNSKLLNNELISLSIRNNLSFNIISNMIIWIALFIVMAVSITSVKFAILPILIWMILNIVTINMILPFVWTKLYNRTKDIKLKKALEKKNKKDNNKLVENENK